MGTVELSIEEYDKKMTELIKLRAENKDLRIMRDRIDLLIDNAMNNAMKRAMSESWAKPSLLDIDDVAKAIGLDWDELLENWELEKKARLEANDEESSN